MPTESVIPIPSQVTVRRFAARLALFYGALFGLIGTHLPFFPVWLKAVGVDAAWIGIITAVPAVTRFSVLPIVTGLAETRQSLRAAMIVTAVATAIGFALVGTQHQPLLVFLAYTATACMWRGRRCSFSLRASPSSSPLNRGRGRVAFTDGSNCATSSAAVPGTTASWKTGLSTTATLVLLP